LIASPPDVPPDPFPVFLQAVDNLDWEEAGPELAGPGEFTGYVHQAGDVFRAQGGTNIVPGDYEITEKVSDDSVLLAASPVDPPGDVFDGSIFGELRRA